MSKRSYRSAYVSVDVPIEDVLAEIDDDQIVEVLSDRGVSGIAVKDIERIYDRLKGGDVREALEICEAVLRPKWRTLAAAEQALAKART